MAAISHDEVGAPASNARWRVVLLCCLAQNCAMGFAFGSFGPLLTSTEQHFGVSRTMASTFMSLIMLTIGLLSPILGSLLQRISVKRSMIVGALLSAVGYWGLSMLQSFELALVMYGLVGIGVCLTAILGPLILVNRWFDERRGRVLSLINLPIALFVVPYIIAELLPQLGRAAVMSAIGTVFLLLAPALLLIDEKRPAVSASRETGATHAQSESGDGAAAIFKRPAFWLLSVGIGIMAGCGSAYMVHIVPFGLEKQMSLPAASALLSIYSGAGIFGTLLFGWIADRIGATAALVCSALGQALAWWGLLQVDGLSLYVVAALLGICVVPLVTLHGAALSQMFGAATVGRAMGLSYSIKLPFIFSFAPGMAWLFGMHDSYQLPFLLTAGLMVLSSLSFYLMSRTIRGKQSVVANPSV